MQCVRLAGKPGIGKRYIAEAVPAGTTIYEMTSSMLLPCKWRWRVYALSESRFLGEMKDWRYFVVE